MMASINRHQTSTAFFEEEQDLLISKSGPLKIGNSFFSHLLQNFGSPRHTSTSVSPTDYGQVRYLRQAKSEDWSDGLSFPC